MRHALQCSAKSVSVGLVRLQRLHAERAGLAPGDFDALTGVSEPELLPPDGRLDAARYSRVMEVVQGCLSASQWPGGPTDLETLLDHLAVPARLLCNCPSLAAAVQGYVDYRDLIGQLDEMQCRTVDGAIELTYAPELQGAAGIASVMGNFAFVARLARHYASDPAHADWGDAGLGLEVRLAPSTRRSFDAFEEGLGIEVQVDRHAATHRMLLRGPGLDAPVERFNPMLYRHSLREADLRLQSLSREPALISQIRAAVEQVWAEGRGDTGAQALQQSVAETLGTSRWTLGRRLSEWGLTFQAVIDELRAGKAQRLLGEGGRSLQEISLEVGFEHQSSFGRFIQRRFGCTPLALRRRLGRSS